MVERATYWNTDEDVWGAGAGAVGAIMPAADGGAAVAARLRARRQWRR